MPIKRQEIIDEARSFLDTPFVHQGRVKGVGCDCAGIVVHLAEMIGMQFWEYKGYGRQPHGGRLEKCLSQLIEIPPADLKPGDVVLLRIRKQPQHIAIITDKGMLHSYYRRSDGGKVVEHAFNDAWRKRVVKCFRFPGVID